MSAADRQIGNASPREIVDRQILAYNVHDADAFCACYAVDAELARLGAAEQICRGRERIRAMYRALFEGNPRLRCHVRARIAAGDFVIDHEHVTGIAEGHLDAVAIYEVRESLIQSVRFIRD